MCEGLFVSDPIAEVQPDRSIGGPRPRVHHRSPDTGPLELRLGIIHCQAAGTDFERKRWPAGRSIGRQRWKDQLHKRAGRDGLRRRDVALALWINDVTFGAENGNWLVAGVADA